MKTSKYKLQSIGKDQAVLWEQIVDAFEEHKIPEDSSLGGLVIVTDTGNELTSIVADKRHDHFEWRKV